MYLQGCKQGKGGYNVRALAGLVLAKTTPLQTDVVAEFVKEKIVAYT